LHTGLTMHVIVPITSAGNMEIQAMSVRQLKKSLDDLGVDRRFCIEKQDLQSLLTSVRPPPNAAAPPPPPPPLPACPVCLEELLDPASLAQSLSCGHSFHRECLRQYAASEASLARFTVQCPMHAAQCRGVMTDAELAHCLGPTGQWDTFMSRRR
jgi:hypothetical protein